MPLPSIPTPRQRSTALPLAASLAALVVYASLYPFSGWRWPAGLDVWQFFQLPWPPWRNRFDEAANFLGYVPLAGLLYAATIRSGYPSARGWLAALLGCTALSYTVEVTQNLLPTRVPSLKDCAFNVGGALAGTSLAALVHALGWVERWQRMRMRWFSRRSAGALVLLMMWPVALLFPTPVPLGLGQIWSEARLLAAAAFESTPWAPWLADWLGPTGDIKGLPLSRAQELLTMALGLAAPCLVAFAATRAAWQRLVWVMGATALALVVSTFSTALNFGPEHAFAWWSPMAWRAFALGAGLAILAVGASTRLAAALGLAALTALVVLVAQAPADPYYAASLQGWEQGRFIRFHGLARWIGWLWPYAAMLWLLTQLSRHERQA